MNNYAVLVQVWSHPSLTHHCGVLPSTVVPELYDITSRESGSSSSQHQGFPDPWHGFHEEIVIPLSSLV